MPAPKSRPPESLDVGGVATTDDGTLVQVRAYSAGLTGTPACVRPVPWGAASAALQRGLAGCGQLRLCFFALQYVQKARRHKLLLFARLQHWGTSGIYHVILSCARPVAQACAVFARGTQERVL